MEQEEQVMLSEEHQDTDNLDVLEQHTDEDERALLAELSGEDYDPTPAVKKQDSNEAALLAGKASATIAMGVVEQALKMVGHKDFSFDPEEAENVCAAAAPLMVKYGGEMPPWLAQYKEELAFVAAAGMLSFSSVQQLKTLKAIDRAKLVESQAAEEPEAEESEHAAN